MALWRAVCPPLQPVCAHRRAARRPVRKRSRWTRAIWAQPKELPRRGHVHRGSRLLHARL